jgi:hypothetical protein
MPEGIKPDEGNNLRPPGGACRAGSPMQWARVFRPTCRGEVAAEGIELEKGQVELTEPIKAIGLHEVQVKVHPEVEFPLTLDIIPA